MCLLNGLLFSGILLKNYKRQTITHVVVTFKKKKIFFFLHASNACDMVVVTFHLDSL